MDPDSLPRSRRPSAFLRRAPALFLFGALLACAAPFAWYRLFSAFPWWDDEGYAMVSAASVQRGFALYDQVYSQYGPFYYLVTWCVGHLPRVRFDSVFARLFAETLWLASATLCGVFVLRVARNLVAAGVAFLLVLLQLGALANEPGHPQGLAVLLLALAVAITPSALDRCGRQWAIALGVLCAALALTKINLGLFLGLSALLCVATLAAREDRVARAVRICVWIAALLVPAALMRVHLGEWWARTYAIAAMSTVLAIACVATRLAPRESTSRARIAQLACAIGIAVLCIAGFALARGTSLHGLARGVVLQHLAFPAQYATPAAMLASLVPWSLVSLALCGTYLVLQRGGERTARARDVLLLLAKLAFGTLAVTWSFQADFVRLLACAGPFLWVALPELAPRERDDGAPPRQVDPRRLALALVAMLQVLGGYPVAGTQMSSGTFLIAVAGTLALADVVARLAPRATTELGQRSPTWWMRPAYTTVACIGLVAYVADEAQRAREYYRSLIPFEMTGASGLRLPELQIATFGWLASAVASADGFYSHPGFNSLYLWSGKPPPSPLNTTFWTRVFTLDEQRRVIDALASKPHVAVVEFTTNPPLELDASNEDAFPLAKYLRASYATVARVGRYELRATPGWTPPPAWCALVRDERVFAYLPELRDRRARSIEIVDLARRRTFADSASTEVALVLAIVDESGEPIALDSVDGAIDLSRARILELRPSDAKVLTKIARAGVPAVRVLGADGEILVTVPILR